MRMKGYILFSVVLLYSGNIASSILILMSYQKNVDRILVSCFVNEENIQEIHMIKVKKQNNISGTFFDIGEVNPYTSKNSPEGYEITGGINKTHPEKSSITVSFPLQVLQEMSEYVYQCSVSYQAEDGKEKLLETTGTIITVCKDSSGPSSSAATPHFVHFSWSILNITVLFIVGVFM